VTSERDPDDGSRQRRKRAKRLGGTIGYSLIGVGATAVAAAVITAVPMTIWVVLNTDEDPYFSGPFWDVYLVVATSTFIGAAVAVLSVPIWLAISASRRSKLAESQASAQQRVPDHADPAEDDLHGSPDRQEGPRAGLVAFVCGIGFLVLGGVYTSLVWGDWRAAAFGLPWLIGLPLLSAMAALRVASARTMAVGLAVIVVLSLILGSSTEMGPQPF